MDVKKNHLVISDSESSLSQNEKSLILSWIKNQKIRSDEDISNHINTILSRADFENAVKVKTSNSSYSIFYVPVRNNKIGLSFFFNGEKNNIDSGNIVVVESKNKQSPILGIKTYYDNILLQTQGQNNFSGILTSYSFSNQPLYDYGFNNGQVEWYGFYGPRKSNTIAINTSAIQKKNEEGQQCEWWGHYIEWSDGTVTLDYVYLVCKNTSGCKTEIMKTTNGSLLYYKVDCGGGGEETQPDPFGIDCASFIFVKTASNWQEAGVKNHKMNMVWMGGARNGLSISLTIASPIIIGVPLERDNGRIKYSSGKAAEIAADIVQTATVLTHKLLKDEPYRPTDAMIEETFRRYLHEVAVLYGGTAGRVGSGSSAIYINNDPRYKLFGTGECE